MAWLWRKKDKDPKPDRARADAASAGADDGVMRQEQPSTGDWMTLPPMATNGPMPTTFRVQTLPEIMTTHQSPRVSGSLGHAVSAQAPSGIVSGLAVNTGAVRSDTAAGAELPLRVPHGPSVEEDAVPVQLALPMERPLPVVPPEPLTVSTLPEPAVSRTLGGALPLASSVDGGRDLPIARTIDAPLAHARHSTSSAPTTETPSPANEATPAESVPGPSLLAPDLLVGGFDRSAFEAGSNEADRELLSPPPDDLAPPIQPRTLQRRLAGARPIEVPPHLRLPSTSPTPQASSPPPMDLPLASPPSAQSTDAGGGGIPVQRVEEPGQVEEAGQAEETAPLVSDQDPITAQRSADTSTATGETQHSETATTALPLHAATRSPEGGVGISAQRTEDTEHLAEDTEQTEDTAPLASEQGPITAQRSADTATPTGAPAQPEAGSEALPLHTSARSPETGVGSGNEQPASERTGISAQRIEDTASDQPASDRSGISAERTEDTERSGTSAQRTDDTEQSGIAAQRTEEVAPLAGEQSPLTAQRSADTTTTDSATGSSEGATAALPLHTATRSPGAGVGSASEQPARERSGISAQRTEDTVQRTEDTETTSTIAPLTTTASPERLTDAGSTTREQIGASAGGLPLAPADWQETLQAPPERGAAASSEGPTPPTFQLQREGGVAGPAAPAGGPAFLPLSVSKAVGTQRPLSSLAPLMPGTTSSVQRSVAAAAAPAPTTTLIRPRATSSGAFAQSGTTAMSSLELPDVITSGALAASMPLVGSSLADAHEGSPPSASGAATEFPLQRAMSGANATTTSAAAPALPLHTPASAIPSAAEIAVSAGLAERGPDGSLHYTNPPAGSQAQREFVVQREGEAGAAAPATPSPDQAGPALGNQILSVAPTPSAPDVTLQEKSQALAEQARKLYPHIRNQLESDIRQQLEARSRASGSR